METIPKNPLLEFNSDTMITVRKQYNLHNVARLNEAIDLFEDWIKKQDHFVRKSYPRDYLERCIIFSKGSVERAKTKLGKLCYYRSLHPRFFEIFDKNEITFDNAILPKLTPDHYRVFVLNFNVKNMSVKKSFNLYKYVLHMLQYCFNYDYSSGFINILDYRDVNIIEIMKHINIADFRQFMTINLEALGMRIKSMHMLTSSKAVDLMVNLFKSILNEKVSNRIHIHTSLETLYEFVPKEILPKEYGGNEKPLAEIKKHLLDTVTSDDEIKYIKEMNKACTMAEYRQKEDLCNDSMTGTFMSLNLD